MLEHEQAGAFAASGSLASTDVVENQHDMECVAVVEAKAAIGPVG
jgi:hypothetical protein